MIVLILLLSVFVLSDEHNCQFSVGGKNYNLNGLKGKTGTGDDSKISTYHYTAAVCSDMSTQCEDIMTGQKLTGVVYQMGGEPGQQAVCWDMLAKWDSVEAMPLDASAGAAGQGKDGLTLSFKNGDPCRGNPRKTKMNMICDTAEIGTLTGFQDDSDSCLFIINFPSKYACSGAGPGPGGSTTNSGGISGGWIFIILLLSLSLVYVVGFFVYGGYTTKEWTNKENCPHTEFWGKFVGWVKLGCIMSGQYTVSATKACMGWCKSKMSGETAGETGTSDGEDPDY